MDNITHSLAGLAIAEVAIRCREHSGHPEPPETSPPNSDVPRGFSFVLRVVSLLANNLPDSDLFLARLTPGKLGYLLQHRGYTHTFLASVPQAGLLWGLAMLVLLRRGRRPSLGAGTWLFAVALVGIWAHIGLDALNSYGVHPFWPWNNHWYYGDTLFIVEPWLWVSWLPALYWGGVTRFGRRLACLLLALGLGLLWFVPSVPKSSAVLVTLWAGGLFAVCARVGPLARSWIALGTGVAVIAGFGFFSGQARARLVHAFRQAENQQTILDVSLTPFPSDPFCWSAIVVSRESAGKSAGTEAAEYRLIKAVVAPLPSLVSAGHCASFTDGAGLAPIEAAQWASTAEIKWLGVFRGDLTTLRFLATFPEVALFLRFTRAPFYRPDDDHVLIGDLRFERGPARGDGGFARIRIPKPTSRAFRDPIEIPSLPPWIPPRTDLLLTH